MCETGQLREDEARALCHFRFFVYRDFREARHLGSLGPTASYPDSRPVYQACKRLLAAHGPEESKLRYAELYHGVLGTTALGVIERPFNDLMAGLTLDDLPALFAEMQSGQIGGGPWIQISQETIRLREAILAGAETRDIVRSLRTIKHNRDWPAVREYEELLAHLRRLNLDIPDDCCILPED